MHNPPTPISVCPGACHPSVVLPPLSGTPAIPRPPPRRRSRLHSRVALLYSYAKKLNGRCPALTRGHPRRANKVQVVENRMACATPETEAGEGAMVRTGNALVTWLLNPVFGHVRSLPCTDVHTHIDCYGVFIADGGRTVDSELLSVNLHSPVSSALASGSEITSATGPDERSDGRVVTGDYEAKKLTGAPPAPDLLRTHIHTRRRAGKRLAPGAVPPSLHRRPSRQLLRRDRVIASRGTPIYPCHSRRTGVALVGVRGTRAS